MTAPLALQLYTLREDLPNDYAGVINRVADIGYVGVEVENVFESQGTTAAKAVALFRELGLEVVSAHAPLPLDEDQKQVLDFAATVGSPRIIHSPGADRFATLDLVKWTCDRLNQAQAVASETGWRLGFTTTGGSSSRWRATTSTR